MTICVTGATGFVGAHVTRALAERGDEVRVIYRNADRLDALSGVRFRRAKADVLGYTARPLDDTLRATIGWYRELIAAGAFDDDGGSSLSRMAFGVRAASRLGLLLPLRVGQHVVRRRMVV